MTIAPVIRDRFPHLNQSQLGVIGHLEGPLLVVAGPGTGKTFTIVLRALNLLLLDKAEPREMILCTFTEKAAFEMRDRLTSAARDVGFTDDLSGLRISTIHSLCNSLLQEHRHRIPLGHNYNTLDDLTQLLFLLDHFDEIIGSSDSDVNYLTKWNRKWDAIKNARDYFNKITEELIDSDRLLESGDPFLRAIGNAYRAYQRCLFDNNQVDFAHLQRLVYDYLLKDPNIAEQVISGIRCVLVDEYQDTNYIQEQLLFKLTSRTKNLCVVGDEDQSLYRFRGATVRNILEFPKRIANCKVLKLTINYRSHRDIIKLYDRWMASADWSNPNPFRLPFRHEKTIEPDPNADHPNYQPVIAIWGRDSRDEAERFADLVKFLRDKNVINDYSQVALLLHSVRQKHSNAYLEALDKYGIPFFCPRARAYFDNNEIRDIIACFAIIFGWDKNSRGEVSGMVADLAKYVDDSILHLFHRLSGYGLLGEALLDWNKEIANLRVDETLDKRPVDYFYRLLAFEPFKSVINNESAVRNLAIFSQLLNTFQIYYHYTVVTHKNRESLRLHLFNSFLSLLYDGGINEYEDPYQPLPKGYVQVMTIHQAKGLEFPVVVVGSLSTNISTDKQIDRVLGPFYHREPFEPEDRITLFDRMRLHYVAFSRAQNLLVLSACKSPKPHFAPIWDGLPQWPYVSRDLLAMQCFKSREREPIKKTYTFTGDLRIYETCPRQYQFFRHYDFTPSRSAVIFFGLLVHQTIEDIHRIVLDGGLGTLNEQRIRDLFERTFRFLLLSDMRPIGDKAKEAAFQQVMNYFNQNQDEMQRIVETEVDISVEKEDYILAGKVDIVLGGDGRLELLDFKTSPRPTDTDSSSIITAYEDQLCTYAYILEQRYGKRVDRLMLYWTSEPLKRDALMVLPYNPQRVEMAGQRFDRLVRSIQACKFEVSRQPEPKICSDCDLRMLCLTEGIIISKT